MIEHKGYPGVVGFDIEAGIFHGEIVGTRDVITFQGWSVAEMPDALKDSVDDYLDFCAGRGLSPSPPGFDSAKQFPNSISNLLAEQRKFFVKRGWRADLPDKVLLGDSFSDILSKSKFFDEYSCQPSLDGR